jgi:hypothetical protein
MPRSVVVADVPDELADIVCCVVQVFFAYLEDGRITLLQDVFSYVPIYVA